MYRPIKKRKKFTFAVERISDTHYAAKASIDFDSPFRTKRCHFEFPISDASVIKEAEKLGMEILLPPDRCRESYEPQSLDVDLDERLVLSPERRRA